MKDQAVFETADDLGQDARKPYSSPKLVTHGTIQELTQALDGHPNDGGSPGPHGTSQF